jgi:hypothetical protein
MTVRFVFLAEVVTRHTSPPLLIDTGYLYDPVYLNLLSNLY